MSEVVYINDEYYAKEDAKISVFDHGLLYGDGVFEGIRVYAGKVFKLEDHVKRLIESAQAIALYLDKSLEEIQTAINYTVKKNKIENGYVRAVITRGQGTLGLNPFQCHDPQLIIIAATIQLYPDEVYEKGLAIITSAVPRNTPEALNPRIKSLNYLNNIMAQIDCINAGVVEALMLNHKGEVAECTGDNIFIVKDGVIKTPPADAGLLLGITRNTVIELAEKDGLAVSECALSRYDILTADECFLTGTAAEIVPVIKLDGRDISTGKPGQITNRLRDLFTQYVQAQ